MTDEALDPKSSGRSLGEIATPNQWAKFIVIAIVATVLVTTGTLYAVTSWTDILPRGETGAQGQIGLRGDQGPRGDRGSRGKSGPAGPEGFAGASGPAGRDSIQFCSDDPNNPSFTFYPYCP